jgi:hypothetical protein
MADERKIADALIEVATQLKYLGNGGETGSSMGAIEFHAVAVKEGCSEIASALSEVAEALHAIAANQS